MAYGKHPLAGIAAAFAGVSGGFSANIMVGPTDSLLAGLTTEGAKLVDPNYVVGIQANWWFLIASTILINGSVVKMVGDGEGNISYNTYLLKGGMVQKRPNMTSNVNGEVQQAVVEYVIQFADAERSIL